MTGTRQHTDDWEHRFTTGDTPWEEELVAPALPDLFAAFAPDGAAVLEVGCGLGSNVLWLAQEGYAVTGCDVSRETIRRARERAEDAELPVAFLVADVLSERSHLPRADIVLARGVLHTFTTHKGRTVFAEAIADLLEPGSLWFDISGSADTPGDPSDAVERGWPRLTLSEIALAVESFFEIVSVRKARYGTTPALDFLAFVSVLRRRK